MKSLRRLITDLEYIRDLSRGNDRVTGKTALAYLLANRDVIRFFIGKLYASSEAERRAAAAGNVQIDYSVVSPEFRTVAEQTITLAEQGAWVGNGLGHPSYDDLHMTLRALRAAEAMGHDLPDCVLFLSPAEEFLAAA